MFDDIQLTAALGRKADSLNLVFVPLHSKLRESMLVDWYRMFENLTGGVNKIEYERAYNPNDDEIFVLNGYQLPNWMAELSGEAGGRLEVLKDVESQTSSIRALIALVRFGADEWILVQHFTNSKVIRPGGMILLSRDVYRGTDSRGLIVGGRVDAAYCRSSSELLFRDFRKVNACLPIAEYYQEASAEQILEVLAHPRLLAENPQEFAENGSQWFRKRFAMLRDSGVLDEFSVKEIAERSDRYDVNLRVKENKIVFPEDKKEAKRLLQFLNEEMFRGPITDLLYETNSRRLSVAEG